MIITHTAPDMDAIASCWLLQRFGGLATHEVVFVNTGNPDPALLDLADAVVDTGKIYDPATNRFDHHQDAKLKSATYLVADTLRTRGGHDKALGEIWPLIVLIDEGDRGIWSSGSSQSRVHGLHAIFSGGLPSGMSDLGMLAWGYQLLDSLFTTYQRRAEGRAALAGHLVYESDDGYLFAIKDAPRSATSAAFERGARLVVFVDTTSNAIGIQRSSEWATPHVGELIERLAEHLAVWAEAPYEEGQFEPKAALALHTELVTWFKHPAGFFAGRGTAKAPCDRPISVDLFTLANLLDDHWNR